VTESPPSPASRAKRSTRGLNLPGVLLLLGGLLAIAGSCSAIALTQLDRRGGVTPWPYFAVPGLILAGLYLFGTWHAWQTGRGPVVLAVILIPVSGVVSIFESVTLGYVCLNYGANPMLMTGCKGLIPNGRLASVAVISLTTCVLIALLAALTSAVMAWRARWRWRHE